MLSARTPSALEQMRARLAENLAANSDMSLADVAFTLQSGRGHFDHRLAFACRDHADAQALLSGPLSPRVSQGEAVTTPPSVAFMFPGQGAQYVGMARGLYQRWPAFRAELDRCAEILSAENIDLIDALYGPDDPSKAERLARTSTAQPAIFSVSYALARLWQSWGVNAQAYVGHSVGEFVAACLAGVLSLPDALRLIAARGRLMQELPSGGMLSVRLSEAEVAPLIGGAVALAAINSPTNVVLAGPHEALQATTKQLEARGDGLSSAAHFARVPFADDGPDDQAVRGAGGGRHAARTHDAVCLERNGRLDPSRRGDIARILGATRTRTRSICRRDQDAHRVTPIDPVGGWTGRSRCRPWRCRQRAAWPAGPSVRCLRQAPNRPTKRPCSLPLGNSGSAASRPTGLGRGRAALARVAADLSIRAPPALDRCARQGGAESDSASVLVSCRRRSRRFRQRRPRVAPAGLGQTQGRGRWTEFAKRSPRSCRTSPAKLSIPLRPRPSLSSVSNSLLLSQVAQQIQRRLSVKIAFRQLLGDLSTIPALERFIRAEAPATVKRPAPTAAPAAATACHGTAPATASVSRLPARMEGTDAGVAAIMRAQVEAMSSLIQGQLETLKRLGLSDSAVARPPAPRQRRLWPPPAEHAGAPAGPSRRVQAEQRPSRFQAYRAGARRRWQRLSCRLRGGTSMR